MAQRENFRVKLKSTCPEGTAASAVTLKGNSFPFTVIAIPHWPALVLTGRLCDSGYHFVIKPPTSHADKSSGARFTLRLIKEVEVIANCSWRTGIGGKMRAGWPRWAHVPNKTQQASWDKCFHVRGSLTLSYQNTRMNAAMGKSWSTWCCDWQQCNWQRIMQKYWKWNIVNGLVVSCFFDQKKSGLFTRSRCSSPWDVWPSFILVYFYHLFCGNSRQQCLPQEQSTLLWFTRNCNKTLI